MRTLLIFAGRSTRFWPLSEKSFFPIAGTCLLREQVRRLQEAGAKDILLVGGKHNLKQAKALFPKLPIVEQKDLSLGMRGALLSALPRCKKEPVMLVSANDVIDPSAYATLLREGKKLTSGGLILARKVKEYFPGGYLSLKGRRVTGIVEKPGQGQEPSDLVNIVAHIHADASVLFKALRSVRPTKDDGYEVALHALCQEYAYHAVRSSGPWQPVKYPWHLLSLLPILLPSEGKPQIHPSAKVHPTAVIEGPVTIGPGARVFAHATVMGPCAVGAGSIIANNALVRGSSIGENCVIGYNTEITRSILGNDVWTHSSYVGDSVFGDNISLGAGTTTGNLRLDEGVITSSVGNASIPTGLTKFGSIVGSGTRMGIHTCLSPGVKVGVSCFVSSALLVSPDIPSNSYVKRRCQKEELEIRPNIATAAVPEQREKFRGKL